MSDPKKLVTAIVVVYNGEKYLKDCLQSIIDQDYQPLEILVIDDGSTDSTPTIIKSFGERIKYFHQNNAGIARARNKGVELANGHYIAFLDADDIWCQDKIATQISVFERYPQYGVVFGEFNRVGDFFHYDLYNDLKIELMKPEIDNDWTGWLYPRMLLDSWVHIITAMVRKDVFYDIGEFNPEQTIGEDYDFWIRTSKKYQMAKIPYPLALYRNNPTSATAKFIERNFGAEIVTKYLKKYGISDPNGGDITRNQIRNRLYELWFVHGYVARNNKQYQAAVQSFGKALYYAPLKLNTYKNIVYSLFKMMGLAVKRENRFYRT